MNRASRLNTGSRARIALAGDFDAAMPGTSAYSMSVSELTFGELLRLFGRRKWIIIINVLIAAAIGVLISYFSEPEYEMSFRILLEGKTQANNLSGGGVFAELTPGGLKYDVPTQMEILKSNRVYATTLEEAGIPIPKTVEEAAKAPKIRIDQVDVSQVVLVNVRAGNPDDVRNIASALPRVYDDMIRTDQTDQVSRLKESLQNKLKEVDEKIDKARQDLVKFQTENAIIDAQTQTQMDVNEQQRTQQQYETALADEEGARAALQSLESQTVPKEIEEVQEQTNNQEQREARARLVQLRADRDQLLTKYYEDHPRVKAIDAQIASLEAYVRDELPPTETNKVKRLNPDYLQHQEKIRNARAALRSAQARRNSLESIASTSTVDTVRLGQVRLEINRLEDEIEELRLSKRSYQATVDALDREDTAVVSPVISLDTSNSLVEQTKPRWTLNLVLAIAIGFLVGAFVAIARDMSLDKINYPAEAVGIAGADVLARIPERARNRPALIEDPSRARAFEAYRILRSSVLAAMQNSGVNSVLLTSSERQVGKTVVSGNLGVACALDGKKTVVVDANLRQPKVDKLFKVNAEKGLTNVIAGEIGLEAALVDGPVEGLQILSAGTMLANPTESIASAEMRRIIEQLRQNFDVVIVDAPDSLTVADSIELARTVQNVVFVAELEHTNKTRFDQALSFMRQAKGSVIGLVLNRDESARERYV